MSNLVIVAIPEEQDRVWKVSSEQVPHLTLLFLGDAQNAATEQITQFVEHAVTLSEHGQFYLDVDRRGILGDAEADVLFFSQRSWNLKWIKQFRGQLLQNQQIRTAYDSTPQHTAPQDWVPHLTLGYPETPANPIPDDGFMHPIYSVCFDRIAVWIDNYDGPEFRLEWPERELDGDLAIAYSDQQKAALMHNGTLSPAPATTLERGDQFVLEHFGIKGMKWGVRNAAQKGSAKVKSGAKAVGRGLSKAADALGEHFYETSPHSSVTQIAIHNQVANEIDGKIHLLQSAPKYRGKNLKADKGLETEYHQDVAKVTDAAYKRAVKDHIGENTKGTKEAVFVNDARGARIEIRHKGTGEKLNEADLGDLHNIQTDGLDGTSGAGKAGSAGSGSSRFGHAAAGTIAIPLPDITIPLKLDDNGQVKAIGRLQAQPPTTIDHGEAFAEGLMHYGVKGMHWGQSTVGGSAGGFRRSAPVPVAPHAESKVPHGKRRSTKIEVDGGENHPASEDAIKVAEAHAKLVKSGPKALTNQELRDVAQRVQLEQQAIQATRPSASKWVRSLLKNQGNQVVNAKIQSKVNPQSKGPKKK